MRKRLNLDSFFESYEMGSEYDVGRERHAIIVEEDELDYFIAEQVRDFILHLQASIEDDEETEF